MASDSKWNKIQNFSNWRIYVYTHTYTYVSVYTQWRICAQRPENSSFFSVVNSSLCSELASRCIKKQKERCSLHLPGDLAVIQFQQQSCRLQSEFAGFSLPPPLPPPPPPPLPLAASPPLLAEKRKERGRGKIIKPGEGRGGEKRERRGRGERNSFRGIVTRIERIDRRKFEGIFERAILWKRESCKIFSRFFFFWWKYSAILWNYFITFFFFALLAW